MTTWRGGCLPCPDDSDALFVGYLSNLVSPAVPETLYVAVSSTVGIAEHLATWLKPVATHSVCSA